MSLCDELNLIGTTIDDKYEVEDCVDEGGFSSVYRATHNIWKQPVAIKCFTALGHAEPEIREKLLAAFVREGKLMAKVSSLTSSVAQARDTGAFVAEDGRWIPYLVLEWLDGASLSAILDQDCDDGHEERDIEDVIELVKAPMHALSIAHAEGVAHLDIKPGNLFVCGGRLHRNAIIKLLDFGVAKEVSSAQVEAGASTESAFPSYTPDYAAPEQYDPRFGKTGPWTDVFGMALLMLEIMNGGQRVIGRGLEFTDRGIVAMRARSEDRKNRPTPRSLGLDVSDEVEAVFAKALSVDPDERYQEMRSFERALRSAMEPVEIPMVTEAMAAVEPAASTPSSSRRVLPQLLALGVSLGGVIAWQAWEYQRGGIDSAASADRMPASVIDTVESDANAPVQPPALADVPAPPVEPVARAPRCPEGMAFVHGGKFFMGSDDDHPVFRMAKPVHQVEVEDYCIDIHEVKLADYRACSQIGECKRAFRDSRWPRGKSSVADWREAREAHGPLCNERHADHGEHPVNCVTWDQARHYCENIGKRLPSEREWEYAARGSDGRVFPWGDENPDQTRMNGCGAECQAWREEAGLSATRTLYTVDDGHAGTAPVGSFPAGTTQHGLVDMIGNVFEWTADDFEAYEDPDAPKKSRKRARSDGKKVIRGGAFNSFLAQFADPALRYGMDGEAHSHAIGFRCAMSARPANGGHP